MKNSNILQIKLSNGDELLCDMIELPEQKKLQFLGINQ